jgi:ubiquinone/menaquinone biosynthesis C-methylase UbiE
MTGYNKELTNEYLEKKKAFTNKDEEILFSRLETVGVRNKHVLDFGCGDGRYTIRVAQEEAVRVVGIDASEAMIQLANQKKSELNLINVDFLVADGAKLPFADETFDVVFANYVLVHFPSMDVPLKEISRVLKPGGQILVTQNNADFTDPTVATTMVPVRLGGKDGAVVHDYIRTDEETKQVIDKLGLVLNSFESNVDDYAEVDREFIRKDAISNFHSVMFIATK